jgi:hypothetical protein
MQIQVENNTVNDRLHASRNYTPALYFPDRECECGDRAKYRINRKYYRCTNCADDENVDVDDEGVEVL